MRKIIIGFGSGYEWDQLRNWVKSAKAVIDENTDIVVLATDMKRETIEKLDAEGVKLGLYGGADADGNLASKPDGLLPVVKRFFYTWDYLRQQTDVDEVIVSDTRDVVFQANPFRNFGLRSNLIMAAPENLQIENEPWNTTNFMNTFGPFIHQQYKNRMICCAGVIGGEYKIITDMMQMIFQLCLGRRIPNPDQAVYNWLIWQSPYNEGLEIMNNQWCINIGTIEAAVKEGSGDIGLVCAKDPSYWDTYRANYLNRQPVIDMLGEVSDTMNGLYAIVHQYDRVDSLKRAIDAKYADRS